MHQLRAVRRVLIAGMLTGGLTLAATGLQAHAAVSVRPRVQVAPAVGAPGAEFGIQGVGFTCGGPVSLYFRDASSGAPSRLGSALPQGLAGQFRMRARVPRNSDGPALITAVQGGCRDSARFAVIQTYVGPGGELAVESTAAGALLPHTAAGR